jgi:hypothetical protein
MNKDASATPADSHSSGIGGGGGRDERGVDPLAFGKAVGFTAGVWSFLAIAYDWRLGFGMIPFWIFIIWFVVLLFFIVRAGVLGEMLRDKVCKYILFLGTCGGMVIGRLDWLAAWNGEDEVRRHFDRLDWPLNVLMGFLPDAFLPNPRWEYLDLHAVAMVYWTVVGLFIASFFCAIRIRSKRKRAGEVRES